MSKHTTVTVAQIGWLAGLLEGEGCFTLQGFRSPSIRLNMTDEDTVRRAASMLFGARVKRSIREGNRKPQFYIQVHGIQAVQWMLTIWSLMGERRKAKIRECLEPWFQGPIQNKDKEICKRGHPLIGDNLQVTRDGRRCRTCHLAYIKVWKKSHPLTEAQREKKRARDRKKYQDDPAHRAKLAAYYKTWRQRKTAGPNKAPEGVRC